MLETQVKKSALSIPVTFEKIEEYNSDDDRFIKVKIWLMHLGQNLNGSIFDKEVVDKAIPTLEYIPIVGFIEDNKFDEADFSDHRYVLTKNESGITYSYQGSAYGVILSSADNHAHFEKKVCDDGIEREFIVADGVMWDFLEDSSNIMNRDLIKDHSIELDEKSIEGYEDEDGIFHFTKFSFRAACILGGEARPAMEGSTVEVQFTMNDFVKNLQSELNDKFTIFTKLMDKQNEQGGTGTMPNTDFTQTVFEMFQDISVTVSQYETIKDYWGDEVPRFYAIDIQDNEVIVVDRNDNYRYYGFSYILNGDKAEIDFTSGKRKKTRYEDYEEGVTIPEGGFDFGKHISNIEEVAFAKVNDANVKVENAEQAKSEAETNYTAIKADYDEIKPKYDAYVQEDEQRQADELNAQKDAKFAEYEDVLSENADFIALKERKEEISVDDIEKECAVLYVKVNRTKNSFSKTNGTSTVVGLPVDDNGADDGYVETKKYGRIRKLR